MKQLFSRPFFWVSFFIFSISCTLFSYYFFSRAFPLVSLDLKMDRVQAVEKAAELSKQFDLGPQSYSVAASFETDQIVKNYVELEAGGTGALTQMLADHYYAPYTWHVRHFKQFEKNEVTFIFKPDGTPYGFCQTVSENLPGAALTANSAQKIAQESAQFWHINFDDYVLIESSKEEHPSGRIDHTFVYERPSITIGKGLYRLKLVVSGDTLTEIKPFIKIPEEFLVRYKEIRSSNNSIAFAANMLMIIVYILGGCVIGLFMLMRRRLVQWRTPMMWGIFIGFLHALVSINQLPLAWMNYNTALSERGFLLSQAIQTFYQFIFISFFYGLVFAAAESLGRKAFGNHLQFWKSWSKEVAASTAIGGRTLGGFLMVPVALALVILFYLITTWCCGWWIPSDALIEPNILATYMPWLSSIVLSLGAGFMEESLFRAVPIAGAAILGDRFGKKRAWLVIGFIIQAIIFGAAHANYPAQPAYARLVELLFFSTINGLVYLRFGLLPAIITHFIYDVMWFALPLFVSHAPNAWINQLLVVLIALIPVWIVVYARIRARRWLSVSPNVLNNAWQPADTEHKAFYIENLYQAYAMPLPLEKKSYYAGLVGLILWLITAQFNQDGTAIHIDKKTVQNAADTAIKKRSIVLDHAWDQLVTVADDYHTPQDELQHLFIWRMGGRNLYHSLLGSYLRPPRWTIRYATFSPKIPTAARVEEYGLAFTNSVNPIRFIHLLPEDLSKKSLDESNARTKALTTIFENYGLHQEQIRELSAKSINRPNRTDWHFIFQDTNALNLKNGQARIAITIAGDEVVDSYRYVHVPEDWERETIQTKNVQKITQFIARLGQNALLCVGIIASFIYYPVNTTLKTIIATCGVISATFLMHEINDWTSKVALFNTSEPYSHQLFGLIGSLILSLVVKGGIITVIATRLTPLLQNAHTNPLVGISAGFIIAGFNALITALLPHTEPTWADYSALKSTLPWLAIVSDTLIDIFTLMIMLFLYYSVLNLVTEQWQKRRYLGVIITLLGGIFSAGLKEYICVTHVFIDGLISGFVFLLVYVGMIRFDIKHLYYASMSIVIIQLLQQAIFNAFPYAWLYYSCTIIATCFFAWLLRKRA